MRSELQLWHHRVLWLRCSDIDLSIGILLMLIHRLTRCTRNSSGLRLLGMLGRRLMLHLLHHEKIMRRYGHR